MIKCTCSKQQHDKWQTDIFQKYRLDDLATWWFLPVDLGRNYSALTDMSKSRELGFTGYMTTDKAYFRLFDQLRKDKVIP